MITVLHPWLRPIWFSVGGLWLTGNVGRMNRRWIYVMLCGALPGCSDAVTDAQWAKTVPGIYEGSQSGFVERVDLNSDGSFRHDAFVDGKSLVSESGKWTFNVDSGMVSARPFTSIWDNENRRLTTNIVRRVADELAVMRYGKTAQRITNASDFEFQLTKKTDSTR